MPDYSDSLHLDPHAIRRFVRASAGWGRYLEGEANKSLDGWPEGRGFGQSERGEQDSEIRLVEFSRLTHSAASSYVIAAGYAGVFEPVLAEALFWTASKQYLLIKNGTLYGGVLAACTNDMSLLRNWLTKLHREDLGPRERLYALIMIAASEPEAGDDFERARILLSESRGWRGAHLTDLFVPASLFIDALQPIFVSPAERGNYPVERLTQLLSAFADQFELASAPRTRWQSFASRFLPVSPEVMATVRAVSSVFPELHDLAKYRGPKDLIAPVANLMLEVVTRARQLNIAPEVPESNVLRELVARRRHS